MKFPIVDRSIQMAVIFFPACRFVWTFESQLTFINEMCIFSSFSLHHFSFHSTYKIFARSTSFYKCIEVSFEINPPHCSKIHKIQRKNSTTNTLQTLKRKKWKFKWKWKFCERQNCWTLNSVYIDNKCKKVQLKWALT